ncbi:dihydrofolate reductase [Candidatus Marinimicrobia bacterium]|nr:dihydrofolate reductase [Candidatus Neomarinimicrobiota bacterium]
MIEIHLIWAQDESGGIGIEGKLPWHVRSDLKNFKKITLNSVIIMGRKTWDSLPVKPLPKRTNIVLSRTMKSEFNTFASYDECLKSLKSNNIKKVFIIGGRSVYKLFFNEAHYLHITHININKNGINEFFPISFNEIKNNFSQTSKTKLSSEATYSQWKRN